MLALRKHGSVSLLATACSALLLACVLLGGGPDEVLGALPAIALLVALSFGHYPGEELLSRLARPRLVGRRAPVRLGVLRRGGSDLPDRIALLASSRPLRAPPPPLALPS